MMKTLLCDLNVYDKGHNIAFVNSIVEYSAGQENIIFLFNRKAAEFCPGLEEDPRVYFVEERFIHKEEKNLINGRLREYKYIKAFADTHKIGRVIFLEID